MTRRIRLLSRNSIRQRQQLRLVKGLALLAFVVMVFSYLFIFVHDIQSARATEANALKRKAEPYFKDIMAA